MHPARLIAPLTQLLCLVASLTAQEYRWEQSDALGIKFRVHRKLQPVPMQIGTTDPHTKIKYEAGDAADLIRGQYAWELYILEFPKTEAARPKPKAAENGGTTAGGAGEEEDDAPHSRMASRNWNQWVTEKDPYINKRTYKEKGKATRGKGKTPDYELWEYSDEGRGRSVSELYWYKLAAAYDFEDKEVVLVVNIPAIGKDKPKDQWLKWASTMISSLEPLRESEMSGGDEPDAKRDQFADTPEKQKELDKAKANILNLDGWDYFTSPNYICLFSWAADKKDKRLPATKFAHEIVDKLEAMREQYNTLFPPHDKMVQLYSILRICNNYDDFTKYSGMGGGVVGYFSPGSKELVIFDDKERIFGNKYETIYSTAMHEGWHQYGYTYFGEKVELHRWFDEGVGDYFGSWSKKGSKWSYGIDKSRLPGIKSQVARKTYINPRELVGWDRSKFYGSPRVVEHYEQAYSIIDFLMRGPDVLGKKFDPLWSTVLDKYRQGVLDTKDPKKAVESAYAGVDWDAFEAAWVDWVKTKMK